jgi:hypothetical protein
MYFQTLRHILFYFLHYFRHVIFGFVFSNTCYVSYFGTFNHDDFKDMIHYHPYFRPFVILNISSLIFNLCFMLYGKLILRFLLDIIKHFGIFSLNFMLLEIIECFVIFNLYFMSLETIERIWIFNLNFMLSHLSGETIARFIYL